MWKGGWMDGWISVKLKASSTSVATVLRERRQKACWHSLAYMNYSASAQRLIVAFTREYTWDIESKER